jgi:hypothetical protein
MLAGMLGQAEAASPPRIELPEMLAIELPAAGMTSIAPGASPLKGFSSRRGDGPPG